MKKKLIPFILCLLILPLCFDKVSFNPVYAQDDDGLIIGKEETTIIEDGLIVETLDSWVTNSDTYFEVKLKEEYVLQDDDYLAIEFQVSKYTYEHFITKFGINGHLLSMGEDGSDTVNSFAALSNGNRASVTQKFNFFFFFNSEFNGTIYIGRDYIGSNNVLEDSISSFRVQYDSSNPTRQTTIVWKSIYITKGEYKDKEESTVLFDFKTLNTNDDKTVNDERFKCSKNLNILNDYRKEQHISIDGVNLSSSLESSMVFGMRSKSDGAIDLSSPEFNGEYTNDVLSLLKFDLKDRSFNPLDGFAFNFYAITNCYFKVIIEDEFGNLFMPNIPSSGSTSINYVDNLSVVKTLQGRYEAFYVDAKQSGTIYIPYSSLIDCKYFQGEAVHNEGSLGQITSIYLGIALSLSPGRRIIFGSFANVSIKEEKVVTIFDTSKLSNDELNYDDITKGSFVYPIGNSIHHINNLKIEKAYPSLLSSFKNIELLKGLIKRCKELDESLYTKESFNNLKNILLTVELSLDNEYLSQEEFDTMYEKLSRALFNLELIKPVNNNVDIGIILFITGLSVLAVGSSLLVVSILVRRKKDEK